MTLDDFSSVRSKNQKRLGLLKTITFMFGINVTAPSTFKDALRIVTVAILIGNAVSIYGEICFIVRFKDTISIIAEAIMLTLQTMISVFKLIYLMFVQFRFYKILDQVGTHELVNRIEYLSRETSYNKNLRTEVRRILDDCWENARKQFMFYNMACLAISGYYVLGSQWFNFYNWYIGNKDHEIVLPPGYFPLWQDRMNELSFYVPLTFAGASAIFSAGAGAVCFDGIFIYIALHGFALIRILKKMIVHTTANDVPKNLRLHLLRQCIDHHERTFQFCKEFNGLYFHISLLQFLLSLVILGVAMFQASVGMEGDKVIFVRMIMYMAAAGFEVVIYCFNGQFISNEFEDLPFAWFDCEWYSESKEFRQLVQMMILRTNRGFTMNASWFSTLTLPTFMAMAKTSGSYFLLLRKFNT